MSATREPAPASLDYDHLLRQNITRVFGERDAGRRGQALDELYTADATLFEPGTAATGRAAISAAVETLLGMLPPDFSFTAAGPAVGHHGVGRLRWRAGPPGGPVAVSGTDVAHFEDGRIRALYVFLDPEPATRTAG